MTDVGLSCQTATVRYRLSNILFDTIPVFHSLSYLSVSNAHMPIQHTSCIFLQPVLLLLMVYSCQIVHGARALPALKSAESLYRFNAKEVIIAIIL